MGGAEGSRPVVTPAVCTQMASFQNHTTEKHHTGTEAGENKEKNLHRGAEGQRVGGFEVASGGVSFDD